MPFGTVGRAGPGMRQLLGFGNQSTGRGTFGGEFVAHHCNQGWLEFAGLENDGLENDGVEQEQTYILHTIKNFNVYDM